MAEDSPKPKLRRWPWVLLVILLSGAALGLKARHDKSVNRERFRIWRAELESLGLQGVRVSFGPLPFVGFVPVLDDFLFRDTLAIPIRSDANAETLINMKSPAPIGLILVDEGISTEAAARLKMRYPESSFPKVPTRRPAPPPMPPGP
jgi:hypothetical protein